MTRSLSKSFDIDGAAATRVVRFRERHRLGLPPVLDVEVRYTTYVPIDDMVGRLARLQCGFDGEAPHVFVGVVEQATVVGSSQTADSAHAYQLRVVPHIATLARNVDSRIFQELDVQEIADAIFADFGVGAVEWRLVGSYPKREYCVQYQESALAFISRLLEQEGIYYFIEPGDDGDTVILTDDSSSAAPIEGDAELPVRGLTSMDIDRDYCRIPADQQRIRSGKFTLRDYNFEKPALDLTASAEGESDTDLEVYDYPGEHAEPDEGKRLAQVRLEAERAWCSTLTVTALCPRLCVGRKLQLTDAGELDGEYFVVGAVHEYAEPGREANASPSDYQVTATLIPADVPYRSKQRTPKPLIHGPQTARIVAPEGSEPETIHTDEHGRCKVKFPWDRSEHQDDKASCWMRVAQLQTSGSLVLPRIRWEVIVEFLEGNPDRPVITGRVYNGTFMPPYALPEGKTRTSLQSASTPGGGGMNEIRLEDKAGSEEIMVFAQHDMSLDTANNKTKKVGNNETTVVGVNSSLSVGADQDIKITKGNQNTVSGDQSITVSGNRNVEVNAVTGLTVHGSATTTVGGDQFEMDGNPLEALLALAAREAQEFLQAKAGEAIAAVQAQVQGAVDQALGPINDLTSQAQALGDNMQAVADGDMGAIGGLVGDASGIPGAGDFGRSLGGGGDGGGGPAGGPLSSVVEGGNMITSVANNAVSQGGTMATSAANQAIAGGVGAAHSALANALGVGSGGGGGSSVANVGGAEGNVSGQDETNREKGPGHSIAVVASTHAETVGSMKITGVLDGINTNVAGSMTQNAGAAHLEVVVGDRAESTESSKTEKALGLVVLSKGGESEQVKGARTTMVGGAIVDKHKGSHQVQAGAPATFIGAFHKLEAKGKITFKCGASEVVIDGSGITITSPMTTILAAKIQLPKKVSEV